MKLEEQNRNQLTFGAGVSQFEGFFGQLSFQTSNFLGRGESFTVSAQSGTQAQNYSAAFTEPFLFDCNITGGANVFKQDIRYVGQFTQKTTGGVLTFGFPLGRGFTRMFTNYSYERVRVTEFSSGDQDPVLLARNPFLRDSLLIGQSGERIVSKVTPTLQYNSVDQPIFPTTGKRLVLSSDFAGIGGNTQSSKPTVEAVSFFKENNRMSIGFRAQLEYIRNLCGRARPADLRETLSRRRMDSVRGYDLRTIGPSGPDHRARLGGNKSLLFNLEQIINIAGPVRQILFYDAGQVRDTGQSFAWKEEVRELVVPPVPLLFDPSATTSLLTDGSPQPIITTGLRKRVQDVNRRGNSILHAGTQRPVSSDFCLQSAARRRAGQQPSTTEGVPVQVRGGHNLLIKSFDSLLTKGSVVMKGSVLAALAFVLSASSAFAQSAGQPAGQAPARPVPPAQTTPRPAAPAPVACASAAAPMPVPQAAPFPTGAKAGFVNLQAIAQMTSEGKAAAAKVNALAQKKQTEGADKAKALQANQAKLQSSGNVMSEAARTQLEKEIERQTVEGQRFEQDAQAG